MEWAHCPRLLHRRHLDFGFGCSASPTTADIAAVVAAAVASAVATVLAACDTPCITGTRKTPRIGFVVVGSSFPSNYWQSLEGQTPLLVDCTFDWEVGTASKEQTSEEQQTPMVVEECEEEEVASSKQASHWGVMQTYQRALGL